MWTPVVLKWAQVNHITNQEVYRTKLFHFFGFNCVLGNPLTNQEINMAIYRSYVVVELVFGTPFFSCLRSYITCENITNVYFISKKYESFNSKYFIETQSFLCFVVSKITQIITCTRKPENRKPTKREHKTKTTTTTTTRKKKPNYKWHIDMNYLYIFHTNCSIVKREVIVWLSGYDYNKI